MYICFSIWPYKRGLPRAIKKPPKVYFFDNADIISKNPKGPVFENLIATHLLKKIHYLEDSKGWQMELKYLRDKESREVDFVILKNNKVFALIEVKWSDSKISKSLQYYSEKLKPQHSIQITAHLKQEYKINNCRVLLPQTALNTLFGK